MSSVLRAGNLIVDRDRYTVWVGDESVTLTYIEFEILATLTRNRGKVLSARQLLESVWGPGEINGPRKLAVHISRLRKKIAKSDPYAIRTVAKRGYTLTDFSSRPRPSTSTGRVFRSPSQGLAEGG